MLFFSIIRSAVIKVINEAGFLHIHIIYSNS